MRTKLRDLLKYRFVSALSVSPDGRYCAFVVQRANDDLSGYISELRIIANADGGDILALPEENAASIAWVDAKTVIVAEPSKEATRFLTVSLDGEIQEYGSVAFRAKIEAATADGRLIVSGDRPILEEKAEEDGHFSVLDEFPFWYDGRGYISKIRRQVFVLSSEGAPVRLSPDNMDVTAVAYDPKNEWVVCAGITIDVIRPDSHRVWIYDMRTRQGRMILEEGFWRIKHVGTFNNQVVIAASDARASHFKAAELVLIDPETTERRVLASDGLSMANNALSDCRRISMPRLFLTTEDAIYFSSTIDYGSELFCCDAAGKTKRLTVGEGSVDLISVAGGTIVFAGLRDMRLGELYIVKGSSVRRLTNVNHDIQAPLPDDIEVLNSEGFLVRGIVFHPADEQPGKKYPGVLCIHGGPYGAYGHMFYHELQVLADSGYYVFCSNPSGSDGRGDVFGDISGRWGTVDYDDIMRFTDAVLAAYPAIDAQRIGVSGGSYGGYMTNWIIGHTHKFACAISDRGISNCVSKDVTGDNAIRFGEMHMKANVYDDPQYMWDRSPLKYAHAVQTPTLFIHGEADMRCHLSQGIMMYTAIRENGVPARIAIFRGETHELCRSGRPRNRIRRLEEIVGWLDRYLKV